MCLEKRRETEQCSEEVQCYSPMNCKADNTCICDSFNYHEFSTLTCIPQKTINETCNSDINCRTDNKLECLNGKCQCIPSYPNWSTRLGTCRQLGNYSESCFDSSDCDSAKLLICNTGFSDSCNCPLKLIGQSYCDCPRRTSNSEYYWNETDCVQAEDYFEDCLGDYMCRTISQGTFCDVDSEHCSCVESEYFDGDSCTPKLPEGKECLQIDACINGIGLTCQDGTCKCDEQSFWKNNECIKYLTYDEGTCESNSECEGELVCRGTDPSCDCPLRVKNGRCDCAERKIEKEFYWDGNSCTPANEIGKTCLNANASFMCQTLTQNTECLADGNGKFICKCSSKDYFDFSSNKCLPKLSINETCSQIDSCREDLKLVCIHTCQCSGNNLWIEGTGCVNISSYNETCVSNDQCKGTLICKNPANDSCSCPLNISDKFCDCATRTKGNEYYWDGSTCVPAQSYGKTCFNSSTNYMCQTMTQGTFCTGPQYTCKCPEKNYFNSIQNKCDPHQFHYQPCNETLVCKDGLGLSCQDGLCKCNEATHFWDGATDEDGSCKPFFGYTEGTCNSDSECKGNLICKKTESCKCPSSVADSNCDCPSRIVGSEYYWDGSDCMPALGYNQPCTNQFTSYMCKTLTENTVCIGPKFTCKCLDKFYFSQIEMKCQKQLLGDQPCSQFDACHADLGLICQNGVCKCSNIDQIWNGNTCISKYSYNEGTCNQNSDCNGNLICKSSGASCSCPTSVANKLCDCPSRKIGEELYWNGTYCINAGTINSTCTEVDYMCQVLSQALSCINGQCVCKTNYFWSSTSSKCVTCDASWILIGSSCYRISDPFPKNIELSGLTPSILKSMCYNKPTVGLARLNDANVARIKYAFGASTTFLYVDNKLKNGLGVSSDGLFILSQYANATSTPGDCFTFKNRIIETHTCDHGSSLGHPVLCEYVLI